MCRLILRGEPVPLYGNGSTKRDCTFIDDAGGIRAAIAYEGSLYEVLNLGNNRAVRLLEMVETIESALGKKARLDFQPPQPGDVPQTWADIEKAKVLLNRLRFRSEYDGSSNPSRQ